MSYEKQTWNKYDDLKTEEENIENGAVVTDNRMNHIEDGIGDNNTNLASHLANTNNPHKVTAVQVGLDKVDNVKQASKVEFDSHTSDNSNPHKVTAAQIGLDKVDNIQQAAKTDFDSHVNNKANPHSVTASQVGAYTKQEIDTKLSKTVMADDSGKVTVKDLKVSGSLDLPTSTTSFPFGYGTTATAERVGNQITLSIASSNTAAIPSGTTMNEKIPEGYRPKKAYSIDFITSGTTYCFYNIGTNGSIQYGGNSIPINSSIRGVRVYYTNDAFPAS